MSKHQDRSLVRMSDAVRRALKSMNPFWITMGVIIAVGVYARCAELSWHFSNNDDLRIIREILKAPSFTESLVTVSKQETNAPFQFLFTAPLLSPAQSYRELLFWGRLPSCVMGILALLVMAYFYRLWDPKKGSGALLGMCLLAFSWENIAYAKQTYTYAIGVLALTILLAFLAEITKYGKMSLRRMLMLSAGLALASSMQYQVLLFIPPFLLVLFLQQWPLQPDKKKWCLSFLAGGLLYVVLMYPIWLFFLHGKVMRGGWATDDPQLAPALQAGGSLAGAIWNQVQFFARNLFVVFQTKTGFLPEEEPLFRILSYLFYGLFLAGILGCAVSRDRRKQRLLLFFGTSMALWWGLTAMHKLTFGPTRHTLILLPFFCVMVGEGFSFLIEPLRTRLLNSPFFWIKSAVVTAAVAGTLAVFAGYFGQFLDERRDLLDENKLFHAFQKYPPDLVIYNDETFGFIEMKSLRPFFDFPNDTDIKTVIWVSRYKPNKAFLLKYCDKYRQDYNLKAMLQMRRMGKAARPPIPYPCRDYQVVHSFEKPSQTSTDFSKRKQSEMYNNSLYFYIFKRKGA